MLPNSLTSTQRTQLYSDGIHATVVIIVVLATTILTASGASFPNDVIGAVFGGAIGYAAGRAGNVRAGPAAPSGRRAEDAE